VALVSVFEMVGLLGNAFACGTKAFAVTSESADALLAINGPKTKKDSAAAAIKAIL
jgi:hypothetical protein